MEEKKEKKLQIMVKVVNTYFTEITISPYDTGIIHELEDGTFIAQSETNCVGYRDVDPSEIVTLKKRKAEAEED